MTLADLHMRVTELLILTNIIALLEFVRVVAAITLKLDNDHTYGDANKGENM